MTRYIDADKVLQYPLRRDRCNKEHANPHFINGVESVMEYIECLLEEEPVDVQEVKHGKREAVITDPGKCPMCGESGLIATTSNDGDQTRFCMYCGYTDVYPASTAAHGRWRCTVSNDRSHTIICNYCNEAFDVQRADINKYRYCPSCGKIMEVVDHDKS